MISGADFKYLLICFIIWKFFLIISLISGQFFLDFRTGYEFTNILKNVSPDSLLTSYFFYPWANFDGVHYLSIAGNGYTTDGRFFPLYPLLIYGLSSLFGDNSAYSVSQFFSAFLLSNVSFILAIYFLYKLIKEDYSEKAAKLSVFFLLIFPTSFFFGSIYSEGPFSLFLVLSFYFANKRRWFIAGIFGLLLALTRINGVFIFPALVYQLVTEENFLKKKYGFKFILHKAWPLLMIPFGLVCFGVFSYSKFGDFFNFIKSHGGQSNGRSLEAVIFPAQTLYRYFKIFIELRFGNFEWWLALLEVIIFVLIAILLYLGYKQGIKRSYLIFSVLTFLLPSLSGTFSGLPRYVLVLFPVFITLALLKATYVKAFYILISIPLLFVLLMLFSRGYYIS